MPSPHTPNHATRRRRAPGLLAAGSLAVASLTAPALAAEGEDYLRVRDFDDGSGVALEISTRTLRPADGDGPTIKLVGVAHIASPEFFAQRQALLDAEPLVLYEGVGPTWYEMPADADDARRARVTVDRIRHIGSVIHQHHAEHDAYPDDLPAVLASVNGYDKRLVAVGLFDGWLRPLAYEILPDGAGFELTSLGADAKAGGEGFDADLRLSDQPPLADVEVTGVRGIQGMMADMTGLAFQLESMDYVRSNWRNADMTVDELMAAMAATDDGGGLGAMMLGLGEGDEGEGGAMPDLGAMRDLLPEGFDLGALQEMFGGDAPAEGDQPAEGDEPSTQDLAATADEAESLNEQFMGLMGGQGDLFEMLAPVLEMMRESPMIQASMRLMMIEMLGRSESLMGGMGGPGAPMGGFMDVILHQRNDVVIDELRAVMDKGNDAESIALFYGAAHLEGLEASLIEDMGYEVVGTDWAPAIEFRYADMGMPPAQGQMIRQMLSGQLEQMLRQMAPPAEPGN